VKKSLRRRVGRHRARVARDRVADTRADLAAVGAAALHHGARQLALQIARAAAAHGPAAATAAAPATASSAAAPAASAAAGARARARGRRIDVAAPDACLAAVGAARGRTDAGRALLVGRARAARRAAAARSAAGAAPRRAAAAAAATGATAAATAARTGARSRAGARSGVAAGVALREQRVRAAARAREHDAPREAHSDGGSNGFHGSQGVTRVAASSSPGPRLRCVLYFAAGVAGAADGSGTGVRCSTVAALPRSGR